jgi:hypothetical protein
MKDRFKSKSDKDNDEHNARSSCQTYAQSKPLSSRAKAAEAVY